MLPDNLTLSNLESYLLESESRFADLVEGTEKKIMWAKKNQQTPLSIVYLHGFAASRQELSPVIENVANDLGANLYLARLSGHGRGCAGMLDGNAHAWKQDALDALTIAKLLGKQVVIIGSSTGATLAAWLAYAHPERSSDILMNVLLSPNFGLSNKQTKFLTKPFGLSLARLFIGNEYSTEPHNERHRRFWTMRYPLKVLVEVLKLVNEIASLDFKNVTVAHHIILSHKDQVVQVEQTYRVVQTYKNAAVSITNFIESEDKTQHVLAGDARSPGSNQTVLEMIKLLILTGLKKTSL